MPSWRTCRGSTPTNCDLASEEIARLATAVDGAGISEFLENLPRSRALHGNGEQLRLLATDHPDHWTIVRQPTTFTWVHNGSDDQGDGPAAPTVTVRAPTADLYLLLWGRRRPTHPGLTVTGDAALLTHRQQHALI